MDFEKVLSDCCAAVQGLMSLAIKLIKEDKESKPFVPTVALWTLVAVTKLSFCQV